MKKAIGIIILGLLLSGCTTDVKLISSGEIYIGMTKQSLCSNLHSSAYPGEDACLRGFATNRYLRDLNKEILWGQDKSIYYVFDNVTIPLWDAGGAFDIKGNGTLKGFYSNEEEALIAAGYYAEKKRKKAEEGKKAKKREEERKKEAKKREEEKKKKKAAG